MEKKKIILTLVVFLLMIVMPTYADNYKVLYANSVNIRIGSQIATKGLVFNDEEKITWTSDSQALKVLNMSTNRVIIIAQKAFCRRDSKSLADYLSKVKHLSTREYGTASIVVDTVYYLLDTLKIDAGENYGDEITDQVILCVNGQSKAAKVQKTQDHKEFVLTRKLFDEINQRAFYIDIVETDRLKDWKYYIYRRLRIELLPMSTN